VTLTAAAATGSTFSGWSGACNGTGSCTVTVDQDRTVTATFAVDRHTLTVTKTGTGAGTVTSSPAGITCGSVCSATFTHGTQVTLAATAAAAAGSTFTGWAGACSGTGSCTVTIDRDRTVGATFALTGHTLTVSKTGTGSGTVTSSPAGITCGGVCSATFTHGTTVTLTATATAGSRFAGWSGACSGTGNCTLTIEQDNAVGAMFVLTSAEPQGCVVPNVIGKHLGVAKTLIKRAHCRVGNVGYAFSRRRSKGFVTSQSRRPGQILPVDTKIDLVVSRGRRP
jgi:uncharacterized repeat protein (TIGR02543 family)